ncbi:hypothetical protein UP15_10215 [Bacillus pumilus]|nr:hypothetical protein UP15_10215 [Bacillus pumilus]PJI12113.1 hypothetical protein CTV96_12640 [Bacillus altitudinis]PKQ85068.1 hypothetical protein CTV98_011170 [Bacillus altitudinis]
MFIREVIHRVLLFFIKSTLFLNIKCIKKAGSLGLERTCEGGKLHHVFTYIIQYLSIVVKTKS